MRRRKSTPVVGRPNPYPAHEVFRHMGEVLWHLQKFEESFALYLARIFPRWKGTRKRSLEALLPYLKVEELLSSSMYDRLETIFEERIWFIHHLHRETDLEFNGGTKVPPLLARLSAFSRELRILQKDFTIMTNRYQETHEGTSPGVDPKTVRKVRAWLERR